MWYQVLITGIQADYVVVPPLRRFGPLGIDGVFSCLQDVGTLVDIELWFRVGAVVFTWAEFAHSYLPFSGPCEMGLGTFDVVIDGCRSGS